MDSKGYFVFRVRNHEQIRHNIILNIVQVTLPPITPCAFLETWRLLIQLLKLMFVRSKKVECLKIPARLLRGNSKVKFKLMSRCSTKYMNSPLYRGSELWDKLEECIQKPCTITEFSKAIYDNNKEYIELLS